jgi:hypothetical protein
MLPTRVLVEGSHAFHALLPLRYFRQADIFFFYCHTEILSLFGDDTGISRRRRCFEQQEHGMDGASLEASMLEKPA